MDWGASGWKGPYEEIKRLGDVLVQEIPVTKDFYSVYPLCPRVHIVLCGRDVNQAIALYNQEYGTDIKPNPANHTFVWASGPDAMSIGFSPRNRYVAFIVGDDLHWDRVGLSDELGHILFGERSHWLGE